VQLDAQSTLAQDSRLAKSMLAEPVKAQLIKPFAKASAHVNKHIMLGPVPVVTAALPGGTGPLVGAPPCPPAPLLPQSGTMSSYVTG
jgi:hypothetical protein